MKLQKITLPANGDSALLVPPIGVRFFILQTPTTGACRISFVGDHDDILTLGLPFNGTSEPISTLGSTYIFPAGVFAAATGGAICELVVQYF